MSLLFFEFSYVVLTFHILTFIFPFFSEEGDKKIKYKLIISATIFHIFFSILKKGNLSHLIVKFF